VRGNRQKASNGGCENDTTPKSFSSNASTASGGDQPCLGVVNTNTDTYDDSDDVLHEELRPMAAGQGPPTTVMMRNIPNNHSRESLLELVESQGFAGTYDLVYLPVDFKTQVGLGYVFINFVTPQLAQRFKNHFQGFSSWMMLSEKVCEVSWSVSIQGINNHIEHFRNSPVMHRTVPDTFKPVLFKDGKRVPFPAPTKRIRAPRLWARRQGLP
jgi:hypothetical protein